MLAKVAALAALVSSTLLAQQLPATATALPAHSVTSAAGTPPPHTLLDGTPVQLRLQHTISSASSRVDQEVPFEVTEPISVNGYIVIPKGALAIARVVETKHKRSMGRGGKLDLSIVYVRLADEEKPPLRAISQSRGDGHVGAMTSAMVGVTILCWPAAPLLLFIHGKDITIPEGSEITAFVDGDMPLDMAHFTTKASANAASTSETSVFLDSSPSSADAEVDGSYVGITPVTVTLASGKHKFSVHRKGSPLWTRTLSVTGANMNISAEFDNDTRSR